MRAELAITVDDVDDLEEARRVAEPIAGRLGAPIFVSAVSSLFGDGVRVAFAIDELTVVA